MPNAMATLPKYRWRPLFNAAKFGWRPLLHMSLQYGELRPFSGWDRFVSLGHPR